MPDKINFEQVRSQALDRVDRSERNFKLAFYAAVAVEGLFLTAFLLLMELHNRTHILILISAIGGYTIVVLGLVTLGAHFNRGILRILKAIDAHIDESEKREAEKLL